MASGMTPVTDPSILAQLNAAAPTGPTPVTDPAILAQLNADSNDNGGIWDNITNDWAQRRNNIVKSGIKEMAGQRSLPELGLQTASNVVGGAWDVPNEIAKSAWGDVPQQAADAIDSTSMGKLLGDALLKGKDAINTVAEKYPRAAENMGAIANLLGAGGSGEGIEEIEGTGSKLGLGDALYNSGKEAQDAAHQEYVKNLVLPKTTLTAKEDMATRTTAGEGLFGKNTYNPTEQEQQVINTVSNIPGISKNNSYQKNLNIIQKANSDEAEALKTRLKANDAQIPDDTILNTLSAVRQNLAKNPYISGVDGAKAADNIVNQALDIISDKGNSASAMLEARKELDNNVLRQKGEKTFNPALDSPITTAVQQVRSAMNNMIADAVPSADVKASLQRQSNMFHAIDNIAPKAGAEAATKIGRAMQHVTPHSLPGMVGASAGLGAGVELLQHLPPSVGLGSALAYGLYKGASAPTTRIALGKALGVSNGVP